MHDWLKPGSRDVVLHVQAGGPLRSPGDARDAIRGLSAEERRRPIRVLIHDDVWLDEPLTLEAIDSGTAEAPVIYQAAPGAHPRVSGGRRLSGWRETVEGGRRCWRTRLPDGAAGQGAFTQLFVNGRRAPRPRFPREGFYRFREVPVDGVPDWAGFHAGDLRPEWAGRREIEIVVPHYWVDSHLGIRELDTERNVVRFDRPAVRTLDDETRQGTARYWVENIREALDTPGQWFLDRTTGELTYLPLPDETPAATEIVAPRLPLLLLLDGRGTLGAQWRNPGSGRPSAAEVVPASRPEARAELERAAEAPVRHVHFVGLHFCHNEWSLPDDCSGAAQAAHNVPGAIAMRYAADCSVRLCEISGLATYAVALEEGCCDVVLAGNHLHDLGGGGVKLDHGSGFCTVCDNIIVHGGRRYPSAIGVWIGHSGDHAVVHNRIGDFFYTGVSAGWVWGYRPSRARRNRIEYNHIHTIGQGLLSDMGAVYTLGVSPGTSVSHNHIHDVRCYGYGGSGLYPDEGTSFIRYEGNLVHHTDSGNIHMNYGRDVVFRHNILLLARDTQVAWGTPKHFRAMRLERNVIVWSEGSAVQANWFSGLRTAEFEGNIWWRGGTPVDFSGCPWEDWQARGFDADGAVRDPLIVAADEGGLALRADSPLRGLGIPLPDLRRIGPRPEVLAGGEPPPAIEPVGACVWTSVESASELHPERRYEDRYENYPDRAPCRVELKAVCENAGDAPWSGEVRLHTAAGLASPLEARRRLTLAPGERAELTLAADIPEGTDEVIVRADADTPGFHSSVLSLGFRPVVPTPRLPADVKASELRTALAGAPDLPVRHAAEQLGCFRLGISGDRLALWVRVRDSNITFASPVYKGSMVDIFGIGTGSGDNAGQVAATFGQVFLTPPAADTPARLLHTSMGGVSGAELDARVLPDGYEIAALIPLSVLKIDVENGEFAFKAAIYTHVAGITGILRAHLFNERARGDIHAYGVMKLHD